MPARTPGNEQPLHPSEAMPVEHMDEETHVGVIGNEPPISAPDSGE